MTLKLVGGKDASGSGRPRPRRNPASPSAETDWAALKERMRAALERLEKQLEETVVLNARTRANNARLEQLLARLEAQTGEAGDA